MSWSNAPIIAYHGTTLNYAPAIAAGPDPSKGSALTDFGLGFYVTTNLRQAKDWANDRHRKRGAHPAAVIEFDVDRDWLAQLDSLAFVVESANSGYWDFVSFCRNGRTYLRNTLPDHGRKIAPANRHYQVVYGPVSLWPQRHVLKDCDQISFHMKPHMMTGLQYAQTLCGSPDFP